MALNIPPRPQHTEDRELAAYEYQSVTLTGANPVASLDLTLNRYSSLGFRLVATIERTLIFERPTLKR